MGLLCKFGVHNWEGCKCIACGKTRDKEHKWEEGEKGGHICKICGHSEPEEEYLIDNSNKSAG